MLIVTDRPDQPLHRAPTSPERTANPPPRARASRHAKGSLRSLALAALALLAGCGSSAATPARTPSARYAAPGEATPARPAPGFALRDSLGQTVRLSQFRGKAVLLTFIYDHCPDTCPLIVGDLHSALAQLGPRASEAQVVAVSVDPRGDTPRTVRRFLALHEMTGRMEYLIGTKRQLAPVWREWGVTVEASPDSREVSHSASVYGITGRGRIATLYPAAFKPAWVVHDVPLLAAR